MDPTKTNGELDTMSQFFKIAFDAGFVTHCRKARERG
jgi:hypothetical protein